MPIDDRPNHALLLRLLRDPRHIHALTPEQFAAAMDVAQAARLLGWFVTRVDVERPSLDGPSWLGERITMARALVQEYDREVHWEVNRIARAFLGSGIPWVLLKGAGYLAAGLPPGRGRRVADIDILVPAHSVADAERLLGEHGWEFPPKDAYDDQFYRTWMHESPPMVHRERGSIVDVHHGILPRTSRLRPSPQRLIAAAIDVGPDVRVLSPAHMIVHAAAHLFHDGEIAGAIRDLVDLDGLLRHFAGDARFWPSLLEEAPALDLARPTYYAVHNAQRMLGTPVPPDVLQAMQAWAPSAAVASFMDRLVDNALSGDAGPFGSASNLALYVRSHWLRMPPLLLFRHLFHKAFLSRAGA